MERLRGNQSAVVFIAVLWRFFYACIGALAIVLFVSGTRGSIASATPLVIIFILAFLFVFFLRVWFLNQFFSEWSYRTYSLRESLVVKFELAIVIVFSLFFASSLGVASLADSVDFANIESRERNLSAASAKRFESELQAGLAKDRELLGVVNDIAVRRSIAFSESTADFFSIQRRALVVANSKYMFPHEPLPGVEADLVKVRDVFAKAGYVLTVIENRSFLETERMVSDFVLGVGSTDLVVVYIAGHGFHADGANFLLSVAKTSEAEEFKFRHNIHDWYKKVLDKNPLFAFFVLDACREKIELSQRLRSFSSFSPPDNSNFITLSSVSAGQLANDTHGGDCLDPIGPQGDCARKMSPFASEFVQRFAEDGLLIDLPRKISNGVVARVSRARQEYRGPVDQGPVAQSPEFTATRQSLPIRHLAPSSSLVSYSAKVDDSIYFRPVEDACPAENDGFGACLDDLRRAATLRIDAVERGKDEILALRGSAYDFLLSNSGKVSETWRRVTEEKIFRWIMLSTIIFFVLLLDFFIIYFAGRKSPTASSETLARSFISKLNAAARMYLLGIMSYKSCLRRMVLRGY